MKGARAHGRGGRSELRDVPTAAARLAGAGFRNWLRSVVPDVMPLEAEGAYASRRPDDRPAETGAGELQRFQARAAKPRPAQPDADLAALCHRLDDISPQFGRLTPPCATEPPNGNMPGPARADESSICEPDSDLAGLERQLKFLTTQLEILRSPCRADDLVAELRRDVAGIADALDKVVSQAAFQSLQDEVRGLGARLEETRMVDSADAAFAGLERGLAELRAAVHLAPVELDRAVQILSQKIDQISEIGPDPLIFRQLDNAIDALRSIVSQIVSGDALIALGKEVRALGERVDQASGTAGLDPAALLDRAMQALERQIADLGDRLTANGAQSDHAVAPAIAGPVEECIRALGEKLDRLDERPRVHDDIASLEKLIAQLSDKLNASEVRLGALQGIERGMADLLGYFAERQGPHSAKRASGAAGLTTESDQVSAAGLDRRSADIGEQSAFDAGAASAMPEPTGSAGAPSALSLTPALGPTVTPHAPHEQPGAPETPLLSNAAREADQLARGRGKRGAAKRKLAVAPAPGAPNRVGARPARPSFIVAARRAAQAANDPQHPLAASLLHPDLSDPEPAAETEPGRTLVVSTSLVLVGLSAAAIAFLSADLLGSRREWLADRAATTTVAGVAPAIQIPEFSPSGIASAPPDVPGSFDIVTSPRDAGPVKLATASSSSSSSEPDPLIHEAARPLEHPFPPAPGREATGSIRAQRSGALTTFPLPPLEPAAATSRSWRETVPPAIATKRLLAGIADRNPAAAYEIARRYSEGHGVTADLEAAAVWFSRAAEAGLASAQFRLGSMYEKGLGVRKDAKEARRLYLAAAAKGHAAAMHNIAVLYAEGIDGKPDFTAAAEWFRRAAEHGIVDSQYNLAVLHARGQGMERNLAESFKWFATAAAKGDREAGARRDEIAAQLDPETLAAAQGAAAAFSPKNQPAEATAAPVPPGGWDDTDGTAKATAGDPSE